MCKGQSVSFGSVGKAVKLTSQLFFKFHLSARNIWICKMWCEFLSVKFIFKRTKCCNCLMNWYFPLSFFFFFFFSPAGRGGIFWVEMFLKCLRHHLENMTKTWYKNNVTFQCGTLQEHIYFTFSVYS